MWPAASYLNVGIVIVLPKLLVVTLLVEAPSLSVKLAAVVSGAAWPITIVSVPLAPPLVPEIFNQLLPELIFKVS